MSTDDRERPFIPSPVSAPNPLGAGRSEKKAPSPGSTGRVPAKRVAVGGEGKAWHQAMPSIADSLRELGYDIESEPSPSGEPPSGSIVARRDLGDRAVLLAIDAGGRFRAAITWVVGEWPSRDEIAGVPVRVVDAVSRAVTVTGQMDDPRQVVEVVAGLGTIAPWASVAESEPPPTTI